MRVVVTIHIEDEKDGTEITVRREEVAFATPIDTHAVARAVANKAQSAMTKR